MNEAAAASKALEDVANNQVIMMELVLYAIISIVLILLMDLWAGKVIGNKQSMEYKVLRIPKYISLFIICGLSLIHIWQSFPGAGGGPTLCNMPGPGRRHPPAGSPADQKSAPAPIC